MRMLATFPMPHWGHTQKGAVEQYCLHAHRLLSHAVLFYRCVRMLNQDCKNRWR